MIRYDLTCEKSHAFDGWFAGSDAFDAQVKRRLVACPHCGSVKVSRAIMAPATIRTDRERTSVVVVAEPSAGAPAAAALIGENEQKLRAMISALREKIIANTEDVGGRFAEEARAIHEGESEKRSIRGQSSPDEIRALIEDGIEVMPVPSLPDAAN